MLMVVDAGFAIPKGLDVVDLSLAINEPTVPRVLAVLKDYFSQTDQSNHNLNLIQLLIELNVV